MQQKYEGQMVIKNERFGIRNTGVIGRVLLLKYVHPLVLG
jgi:hypothetical protein